MSVGSQELLARKGSYSLEEHTLDESVRVNADKTDLDLTHISKASKTSLMRIL